MPGRRKAILNVAAAGYPAGHAIAQYAAEIWQAKPCPVFRKESPRARNGAAMCQFADRSAATDPATIACGAAPAPRCRAQDFAGPRPRGSSAAAAPCATRRGPRGSGRCACRKPARSASRDRISVAGSLSPPRYASRRRFSRDRAAPPAHRSLESLAEMNLELLHGLPVGFRGEGGDDGDRDYSHHRDDCHRGRDPEPGQQQREQVSPDDAA